MKPNPQHIAQQAIRGAFALLLCLTHASFVQASTQIPDMVQICGLPSMTSPPHLCSGGAPLPIAEPLFTPSIPDNRLKRSNFTKGAQTIVSSPPQYSVNARYWPQISAFKLPSEKPQLLVDNPLRPWAKIQQAENCCGDRRLAPIVLRRGSMLSGHMILAASAGFGLLLYCSMLSKLNRRKRRRPILFVRAKHAIRKLPKIRLMPTQRVRAVSFGHA